MGGSEVSGEVVEVARILRVCWWQNRSRMDSCWRSGSSCAVPGVLMGHDVMLLGMSCVEEMLAGRTRQRRHKDGKD